MDPVECVAHPTMGLVGTAFIIYPYSDFKFMSYQSEALHPLALRFPHLKAFLISSNRKTLTIVAAPNVLSPNVF